MKSREEILKFIARNKAVLHEQFHVVKIGVFGSYARGEQHEGSDVDLLVEFEEGTTDLFELKLKLKELFRDRLGLETDICREKYIKPRIKASILNETIYAY